MNDRRKNAIEYLSESTLEIMQVIDGIRAGLTLAIGSTVYTDSDEFGGFLRFKKIVPSPESIQDLVNDLHIRPQSDGTWAIGEQDEEGYYKPIFSGIEDANDAVHQGAEYIADQYIELLGSTISSSIGLTFTYS